MAMVRITNGDVTSRVPYSAYISLYRRVGFTIVDGEDTPVKKPVQPKVPDKVPEKVPEKEPEKEPEAKSDEDEDIGEAPEIPDAEPEDNGDEEFLNEILEKPLSQWSKDELQRFVIINEIDISGAKKTSEVRSIVKGYLDEIEKQRAEAE